jgi:hypothetical protein
MFISPTKIAPKTENEADLIKKKVAPIEKRLQRLKRCTFQTTPLKCLEKVSLQLPKNRVKLSKWVYLINLRTKKLLDNLILF